MTDRYILCFKPSVVHNMEKELLWVKALKVHIQSKQFFLGTAVA